VSPLDTSLCLASHSMDIPGGPGQGPTPRTAEKLCCTKRSPCEDIWWLQAWLLQLCPHWDCHPTDLCWTEPMLVDSQCPSPGHVGLRLEPVWLCYPLVVNRKKAAAHLGRG
jgi:hypothetical protein